MAAVGVAAAVQRGLFRGPAGYLRSGRDRRRHGSGRAAELSGVNPTIGYPLPQPARVSTTRRQGAPGVAGRSPLCHPSSSWSCGAVNCPVRQCSRCPSVFTSHARSVPAPGTAVSAGAGSFPSCRHRIGGAQLGNSCDGRPPCWVADGPVTGPPDSMTTTSGRGWRCPPMPSCC